jgi:hypothetical protein
MQDYMTESEKLEYLASGFKRLNAENKDYLGELSQKLLYAQYPSAGKVTKAEFCILRRICKARSRRGRNCP